MSVNKVLGDKIWQSVTGNCCSAQRENVGLRTKVSWVHHTGKDAIYLVYFRCDGLDHKCFRHGPVHVTSCVGFNILSQDTCGLRKHGCCAPRKGVGHIKGRLSLKKTNSRNFSRVMVQQRQIDWLTTDGAIRSNNTLSVQRVEAMI